MNRKYDTEEYYESCVLLRKYFENPAITTDVIVGFPGETEEEFAATEEFLRKVGFAEMHVFKYSVRQGTRAARMDHQVPDQVKHARSAKLIELNDLMHKEYQDKFEGRIEKILVEEEIVVEGNKYQIGHNERYIKFAFQSETSHINEIVSVKVTGRLSKDMMLCEI